MAKKTTFGSQITKKFSNNPKYKSNNRFSDPNNQKKSKNTVFLMN
ncbi:hypothetical protein ENHAE0001_2606 [Enhydrobacter aerosaccus SK60]|nr:hypothetical protein ENHAE0001_2606 [Enhydrobacter aerosaccus SK60]